MSNFDKHVLAFSPTHIRFRLIQQFKDYRVLEKIINFWYTFGWKWWVISFRDYLGLSDACSYDVIDRAGRFGFQNFFSPDWDCYNCPSVHAFWSTGMTFWTTWTVMCSVLNMTFWTTWTAISTALCMSFWSSGTVKHAGVCMTFWSTETVISTVPCMLYWSTGNVISTALHDILVNLDCCKHCSVHDILVNLDCYVLCSVHDILDNLDCYKHCCECHSGQLGLL